MNNQNDRRNEAHRQPLGSIRNGWRMMYSVLFVSMALPGTIFIIWVELAVIVNDTAVETVKALLLGIALVGGVAITITGIFVEGLDVMLGTRDLINEWLQKRRDEAEAKGIKIGVASAKDWYLREREALEKGEPFDEPPPWEADDKE